MNYSQNANTGLIICMCTCTCMYTLACSRASCRLHPSRLTLVPLRGHLLLVYADWTPAIRGCKSGELLKRAVCVVARGSSVLREDGRCFREPWCESTWDWVNQWVSWRGFHHIVPHVCLCACVKQSRLAPAKHNSHSPLRYNLMRLCFHRGLRLAACTFKISYRSLPLANSFKKLSTGLQQISLWRWVDMSSQQTAH